MPLYGLRWHRGSGPERAENRQNVGNYRTIDRPHDWPGWLASSHNAKGFLSAPDHRRAGEGTTAANISRREFRRGRMDIGRTRRGEIAPVVFRPLPSRRGLEV